MNLKQVQISKCSECPFANWDEEKYIYSCDNPKYIIEDVTTAYKAGLIHSDCALRRAAILIKLSDDGRKDKATGNGEPGVEIED